MWPQRSRFLTARAWTIVFALVIYGALSLSLSRSAFAQAGAAGAATQATDHASDSGATQSSDRARPASGAARAESRPAPFQIPALTAPVMDLAGVLNSQTVDHLNDAIRYLREQGGAQITVLTLPTLGGLSIEEASIKITDQWRLGTKRTSDGVLFLIAPSEHRMRIEVGQGLEGDLTDAISHRIIDESVTPLFKAGDIDSGITVGVYKIAQVTNPNIDLSGQLNLQRRGGSSRSGGGGSSILLFIIIFVVIWLLSGRGRRGPGGGMFIGGGGFGGGGFGGGGSGGWGGGGGGFSGGGSSGGW